MQSNSTGRKAEQISFEFDAIELGREEGWICGKAELTQMACRGGPMRDRLSVVDPDATERSSLHCASL
jgi:hypothetical protein